MTSNNRIEIRPVAWVHNEVREYPEQGWKEIVSEIEVAPELEECLYGIEDSTDITLVFWLDRVTPAERSKMKFHPHDREDLPLLGAFATHSQWRPNPIGITTLQLLERKGNRLKVKGLDTFDGTPVLDIKAHFEYPGREHGER